jgi:hypothetical protein
VPAGTLCLPLLHVSRGAVVGRQPPTHPPKLDGQDSHGGRGTKGRNRPLVVGKFSVFIQKTRCEKPGARARCTILDTKLKHAISLEPFRDPREQ